MMGKKTKTDSVEAIAEKMIEDFPLTSIINENFLEKYVMSAREYPDSEEKVLERTQYFVQTSYLASGKIWTALETANQPHKPTPPSLTITDLFLTNKEKKGLNVKCVVGILFGVVLDKRTFTK